jgi:predicted 2-oxoglutarate/Fe(II)-dependent dioxygenase YbiX
MKNVIEHTKFIHEYQNVVSKYQCEEIRNLIQSSKILGDCINKNAPRTRIRNNSATSLTMFAQHDENIKKADDLIHQIFSKVHLHYLENNKNYFSIKSAEHLHYLTCSYTYRTYDETDYYDWHIDSSYRCQFVFSYILYLNDDFDGGDTLFLHQKLKIKPKTGNMLCFPCDFQTVHKSTPIKRGKKDIIWTCMEFTPRE